MRAVALQAYELEKAGRYTLMTDSAGHFSLPARLQDSIVFSASGHLTQRLAVRDLLRQPVIEIRLLPRPCVEYVPCSETTPSHFVFIGQKKAIGYAEQPNYCNRISMDSKFAARYKVLENVYNSLSDTVLNFVAYDHYGWPGFSQYETVLMFVSRYCGEYIHQKYQYYPLYRTTDGRWAAPVMPDDITHPDSRLAPKPQKIPFATPVSIDVTEMDAERRAQYYPAPYYRMEGDQAVAVYGNYVPELVEKKKQTVLKARGIKLR
jgi:hypothetical protein